MKLLFDTNTMKYNKETRNFIFKDILTMMYFYKFDYFSDDFIEHITNMEDYKQRSENHIETLHLILKLISKTKNKKISSSEKKSIEKNLVLFYNKEKSYISEIKLINEDACNNWIKESLNKIINKEEF